MHNTKSTVCLFGAALLLLLLLLSGEVKSFKDPIDIVNEPEALEQCLLLNQSIATEEHDKYEKGQFRHQKCSLSCQYRFHGQERNCLLGGCAIHHFEEDRVRNVHLNQGQPCPTDARGVCHEGSCHYKQSNHGNVTVKIDSIAVNPDIYKKGTYGDCNAVVSNPNLSLARTDISVVVCIDSNNPNSTTFMSMHGFHDALYSYPNLNTCDLLLCHYWVGNLKSPSFCRYNPKRLPSESDNINLIIQRYQSKCILDVIQLPLRPLVEFHRAAAHGEQQHSRQLEFSRVDTKINVTLDWTGMIL